jgi:glycosyltransferase involved in cell wall biosynthesis
VGQDTNASLRRLPIVAVDATGTRDEVDNDVEGLLTENDSNALAQALEQVLGDAALYARLKAAATKKAKSFDMMLQAEKMIRVYEQAIEDKKSNRFIAVDQELVKEKVKEQRKSG